MPRFGLQVPAYECEQMTTDISHLYVGLFIDTHTLLNKQTNKQTNTRTFDSLFLIYQAYLNITY